MCRPSATRAMEPNSRPPTISSSIIALQSQMTAQVRRSDASCPSPRKMWLCPVGSCVRISAMVGLLLRIRADDIEELLDGVRGQRARMQLGIHEVGPDVVLDHLGREAHVAAQVLASRCMTFSQPTSLSSARSTAPTCPRMRHPILAQRGRTVIRPEVPRPGPWHTPPDVRPGRNGTPRRSAQARHRPPCQESRPASQARPARARDRGRR